MRIRCSGEVVLERTGRSNEAARPTCALSGVQQEREELIRFYQLSGLERSNGNKDYVILEALARTGMLLMG